MIGSHRARAVVARGLLIALLLFVASRLAAPETFSLSSGTLRMRVVPALPGGTVTLPLGPFGELSWRAHDAPLDVEARFIVAADIESLPSADEFEPVPWAYVRGKLGWLIAFGALFGLTVMAWGPGRRRLAAAGVSTAALLLASLGVGAWTLASFDDAAFSDPRYRGPIGDVPRILQLAGEIQRDFPGAKRRVGEIVAGLQRLHTSIVAGDQVPPAGDATRLLLISDLQNNPLGLVIAGELVERFDVDAVIDAGDLTDRGTAIEGELFAAFADLDVPHVIAPGNHEDRAALARAASVPGVIVVEEELGEIVEVVGARILAAADPNATSVDSSPNNEVAAERIPIICDELARRIATDEPDVLLVHDPRLGECAARRAQEEERTLVFAWGHTHAPAIEERGTVLGLSAGTSGANGPKSSVDAPYGFALVELDPQGVPTLACLLELDGLRQARQISCRFVGQDA